MTATPVPEKRHSAIVGETRRAMALQAASDRLGQQYLSAYLGIAPRTLRAYLAYDRTTPGWVLSVAANALTSRAAEIHALAEKLRELSE